MASASSARWSARGRRVEPRDRQRDPVARALQRPGARHEAVDQEGADRHVLPDDDARRPLGDDDPRSVGVREQEVLVVVEEARRSRRVGIRSRRLGQVEQLRPSSSRKTTELRPQAVEHLAQLRQPAPHLGVHDARGAERREVAADQVVEGDRRTGGRSPSQASIDVCATGAAPSPQAARRHLHERHARPDRHLHRQPVVVRATARAGGRRWP